MTFCQSKGDIPYFETSAKEAINIDQAFEGKQRAQRASFELRSNMTYSHCTERVSTGGIGGVQRRL